jgi:hypothetical protein
MTPVNKNSLIDIDVAEDSIGTANFYSTSESSVVQEVASKAMLPSLTNDAPATGIVTVSELTPLRAAVSADALAKLLGEEKN